MILPELLSQRDWDIHRISAYFNTLLTEAVAEVNANFSPKHLVKSPRQIEPLPTDTRQLSSYRTRIGIVLEYALSTTMAYLLNERYNDQYFLTFATSHEYPDFYLRDNTFSALLRIEMKAVDADSDEQAARFSTPTIWIDPLKDMLLLVGWEWKNIVSEDKEVIGEFPHIFASLILPAAEIARERDKRLAITGGKIEGEQVYVYSKKKADWVLDPGNYGKFWRIVHTTRQDSEELSDTIRGFMDFLKQVDQRSPRNRLGKGKHNET